MAKVTFKKPDSNDFLEVVRGRVEKERERLQLSRFGTVELYIKATVIVLGYLLGLYLLYFGQLSSSYVLLTYFFLGCVKALNGLNIAHDANHGSFSKKRWVNRLFASLFDLSSTSSLIWRISHNTKHHVYTNIMSLDDDIHKAPLLRLNPFETRRAFHRFQHVYAPLLYLVSTLNWAFVSDFIWYFSEKWTPKERLHFWGFKCLNLTLFLFIPLFILSVPWWIVVLGVLIVHLVAGIVTATVFQLAHVVEEVEVMAPSSEKELPYSWAEHEMRTTADFGVESFLVGFLTGGLNFQVEHHLFPEYSHVHYPWIQPIVKETAKEFSLPYHANPTLKHALLSHYRYLKKLGTS